MRVNRIKAHNTSITHQDKKYSTTEDEKTLLKVMKLYSTLVQQPKIYYPLAPNKLLVSWDLVSTRINRVVC